MRRMLSFVFLVLIVAPATAQTASGPRLTPGDTWTYEDAVEKRGVRHVTQDIASLVRSDRRMIELDVRPLGSANPGQDRLFGPDWSRIRSIDGRQTVVNQPLAFPMRPGKSWTLDYTETTPGNRTHTSERWNVTYTVAGWEDITVPGGTFHVLRIEGEGLWTAGLPANVLVTQRRGADGSALAMASKQPPRVASGRILKTFWYAPEVHRWVRSEEDLYDSNGTRSEHSTEILLAYTLADPNAAAEPPSGDAADALPPKHAAAHRPRPKPRSEAKHPHPVVPPRPALQETRLVPSLAVNRG